MMCGGAGRLLERARRPPAVTLPGTALSLASPARDLTSTAAAAAGAGEALACRTETARTTTGFDVLHHQQTTASRDNSTSIRKEQRAHSMT